MSWILSWTVIVRKHLKLNLGTNNRSNQIEPYPEGGVQNSRILPEIRTENMARKLEKVEIANETNAIQLENIVENHEAQCKETEKSINDIKEAMKMQHREMRRRLERLEKKTNSGYFN